MMTDGYRKDFIIKNSLLLIVPLLWLQNNVFPMPIHVNKESVSTHIFVCVGLKQNPILNVYFDTDLHSVS